MKDKYEKPLIEVILMSSENVIVASNGDEFNNQVNSEQGVDNKNNGWE